MGKKGKTDWGKTVFHTLDIERMLWFAQNNKNCNIFIDDSGENLDRSSDMNFFCTCGRRWGHRVFIIAQRAMQVHPNVRANCEAVFCFRQSMADAENLADEYGKEFIDVAGLKKGEYLAKSSGFSVTERKRVF